MLCFGQDVVGLVNVEKKLEIAITMTIVDKAWYVVNKNIARRIHLKVHVTEHAAVKVEKIYLGLSNIV